VIPPNPVDPDDLDGDGIDNTWLVGGKAAPAPGVAKARLVGGNVKLALAKAPKGAKKIRVYRADGKGGYKLVKTITPKSKSFVDTKVKAGHTYKYKTVAVNAKGQQGAASKTATIKVKKTKKK
jgi:fibronectin type 3 domain-containing protein